MGGHFAFDRLFDDLKIRSKMLVGFTAVLVILLAISVSAVWNFSSTKAEVETYSQRVKVVAMARQLDRDVVELRRFAREYGLTGREVDAVAAKKIGDSIGGQIAAALIEIKDPGRR